LAQPEPLFPDQQFVAVWPRAPTFTAEGAAIVRFLTARECQTLVPCITNIDTRDVTHACDICQFECGARLETVARLRFPNDGRFFLTFKVGPPGAVELECLAEVLDLGLRWTFTVEGAPPLRRPLWQILAGRPFSRLVFPRKIAIEPSESIVHVPDLAYRFTCRFRRHKPDIKVQGLPGDPEEELACVEIVNNSRNDDWGEVNGELICPRAGAWQVLFKVSESCVVKQVIVAGPLEKLEPTEEESIALGIPVPLPPSKAAHHRASCGSPKSGKEHN
jgi:hypothetical protein